MTHPALVFDLDNTLYASSSKLFDQIDQRMTAFVAVTLALDVDNARALQKQYFHDYGTTLIGLMQHHNVEPTAFMDYVHEINLSEVPADPGLKQLLENYPGQKVVFTNGSTKHAENVLRHLQIDHTFDGIFDIALADYQPKPYLPTYHMMIQRFGINPANAIMFDDIPRNLQPAAAIGMTTVWVNETSEYTHLDAADGSAKDTYIHHTTNRLADWLDIHLPRLVPIAC